MQIDLESISRHRLAFLGGLAAAVRRQCGLEWTPRGYRLLPRSRMAHMDKMVRAPLGVAIHVVRVDAKAGTATIEWEDDRGRVRQAEVSQIALQRHARRRAAGQQ